MKITVCVCTLDRPARLARALESLSGLTGTGDLDWEVLVVDNGSDRRTEETSLSFSDLRLRFVREPRAGLSHARNRAIAETASPHLIFIDDDVTVPPAWLGAYAGGFHRYPEAAFFGGPIVARVEGVPPRRLGAIKEAIPGALTWLEPDIDETVLAGTPACRPWGANMAFRRACLAGRSFDVRVGRRPGHPHAAGEETLLLGEMLAEGLRGVWLPAARLDHHVSASRCSRANLRRHSEAVGWYLGYRAARVRTEDPISVRTRVAREVRECRWRYWGAVLRRAPLAERLAALHRLEVQRGWRRGWEETLPL